MIQNLTALPIEMPADFDLARWVYKDFSLSPDQLDALPWQTTMDFRAYGLHFSLRSNDPAVLAQVEAYLPYGWEPAPEAVNGQKTEPLYSLWVGQPSTRPGGRPYHRLYFGDQELTRGQDLEAVLKRLEAHSQLYVGEHSTERLFVHAGVVGWQGQAIVMPGRSFSGKTSLVAALLEAGATYYSDEYALFDRAGRVWPYPIQLSLRARVEQAVHKCAPEAFGAVTGTQPLPVGLVVVSQYQAGAAWRPQSLTPGRAVLALLDNTVAARSNPALALPILQQVVAEARAIKSKRGEAVEVVESLLD